jgi:hypothetical protein
VTGDLDKEERRVGGSGYDLGAGFTRCDGGINERLREEGSFASLCLPIFDMPEVTRAELDKAGPSFLPNAERPRPIGNPVRWERAVHREGRAAV